MVPRQPWWTWAAPPPPPATKPFLFQKECLRNPSKPLRKPPPPPTLLSHPNGSQPPVSWPRSLYRRAIAWSKTGKTPTASPRSTWPTPLTTSTSTNWKKSSRPPLIRKPVQRAACQNCSWQKSTFKEKSPQPNNCPPATSPTKYSRRIMNSRSRRRSSCSQFRRLTKRHLNRAVASNKRRTELRRSCSCRQLALNSGCSRTQRLQLTTNTNKPSLRARGQIKETVWT